MDLKTKKIMAYEFLLIVGCCVVTLLCLVILQGYNLIIDIQVEKIELQKEPLEKRVKELRELSLEIKSKIDNQVSFYEKTINKGFTDYKDLWKFLENLHKNDSIDYKWNYVWKSDLKENLNKMGFKNSDEFNEYIKTNSLTNDDKIIQEKIKSIKNQIYDIEIKASNKKNQEYYYYDDLLQAITVIIVTLLVILYPLRFLIYAIRWSLHVLWQK